MTASRRYRDGRRRILLDMHIGDWDARFLSNYDPVAAAQAAVDANADAAMIYFQSHVGLCYWPTRSGTQHRACQGRDLAGETLAALTERNMPVCGYYSIGFNNRAYLDHPDWRIRPAAKPTIGALPRDRYGIVCLNNPDYRTFVAAQCREIFAYDIDAIFFDMVWWNGVCLCDSCRARYRRECNAEIPEIVDWHDPDWTRFQLARESWLTEFAVGLRNAARAAKPGIDVYHNFALGLSNWTRGLRFSSVAAHDFLGGDYYGGRAEQIFVTRLMLNLTPHRPPEFMTTVTTSLIEHTRLRSPADLKTKALAAQCCDAAFLGIVAIDPDGRVDPEAIARLKSAFDEVEKYQRFSGGEPVESVGIYFSDASRMNVRDSRRALSEAPASSIPDYPHFLAATGAARIFQQAHVPFGVLTSKNLGELDRWGVIVLPNVQRMDAQEIAALRSYVAKGGRVYASGSTSLAGIEGAPCEDFALADVFGCHYVSQEAGPLIYLQADTLREIARPLSHPCPIAGQSGSTRIRAGSAERLAGLALPYGYPASGTVEDGQWASIHCWPPWQDEPDPTIVRNHFGEGIAIYSAADIECGASPEHDALFRRLVKSLLPVPLPVEVRTHPSIWVNVFHRAEPEQFTIRLLNYPLEHPAIPIASASVTVRLGEGKRCTGLLRAPDMAPLAFGQDGNEVRFETGAIVDLAFIILDVGPAGGG